MQTSDIRRYSRLDNSGATALLLGAFALIAGACSDPVPSEPNAHSLRSEPHVPTFTISDGAHGGNARLYFLPPMVIPPPSFSGTFDATAFGPGSSDEVSVCHVAGPVCVAMLSFGPDRVRMDPIAEAYSVIWPTKSANLIVGAVYRIEVKVSGQALGYADVLVVRNGADKQVVNPTQFVGVIAGTTLSIRFRLEAGPPPLHTVSVAASPASGGTVSVTYGACQGASCTVPPGATVTLDANASTGYTFSQWSANCTGSSSSQFNMVVTTSEVCTAQFALTPPSAGTSITAKGRFGQCGLAAVAAYCWGINNFGQLGIGIFGGFRLPVAVSGGLSFSSITNGGYHTCGLTTVGEAWCWGHNEYGELGSFGTPVGPFQGFAAPIKVSGGLTFGSITSGESHVCALTLVGDAYCWGYNGFGQLGDGTNTNSPVPVAVAGGHHYTAISAGAFHTCAIGVSNTTYCWGRDDRGQAGGGGDINTPRGLAGAVFASISAGGIHTCGLAGNGQATCWGANSSGQLGSGNYLDGRFNVTGPNLFIAISAGDSHSCGLVFGGAAYCWGLDNNGELGDADFTFPFGFPGKTSPQPVSGGLTFSEISAGPMNTCARTTGGAVYCWGANSSWNGSSFITGRSPILFAFP